ncbi:MAG: hypothetical protein PHE56_11080 [Bacteroidales bacterium]|nr:hypothetical protein [Bacteroidales bacterium]
MRKILIFIVASLLASVNLFGQADIIQFHYRTNWIMADSVTHSDSISLGYFMKLTDKTTTQRVIVLLGTQPETSDIDSLCFDISEKNGVYQGTSTELGPTIINGRMLIPFKNYHKTTISQIRYATAYLYDTNNNVSKKRIYRNNLP